MILKILCCLIPELLNSQTWTAGHLSSGVTATPYQPFTAEGKKKNTTTDNCGNLIATKATQGSFGCNLIQQEPVTFRNHCQLVRRFMFFPHQPVAVSQPTWQTILKQCVHDVIRHLNRTTTKETAYKPFRC